MSVEDYLSRYYWITQQIVAIDEELTAVRAKAYSVRSSASDGMPRSHNLSDLSGAAGIIVELEELMKNRLADALLAAREISETIDIVTDPRAKAVLTLRHVRRMKWEDIGLALGMSKSTVHRMKRRGYKQIEAVRHFGTMDCGIRDSEQRFGF